MSNKNNKSYNVQSETVAFRDMTNETMISFFAEQLERQNGVIEMLQEKIDEQENEIEMLKYEITYIKDRLSCM